VDPSDFEAPRTRGLLAAAGAPRRFATLTGLDAPVSAIHDPDQDVYFVSNINGAGTDKDNNGYIQRVTPDGRAVAGRFIEGGHKGVTLNAPKGLAILGNELWVADIDVLRAFDRRTGKPTREARLPWPGGLFLNGLAAGPDNALYVTDTRLDFSRGAIHDGPDRVFRLGRNGIVTIVFEGDLEAPSGIAWDAANQQFLIASLQGKHIYAWRPEKKTAAPVWTGVGGYDGIVVDGARWIVSSLDGNGIYEIINGRETKVIADLTTPATIGYDARRKRLLIPSFDGNTLQIWIFN